MKLTLKKTQSDPTTDSNFQTLNYVLNGFLGIDNLNIKTLEGITDPVADTKKEIKHLLHPQPELVIPVTGDVYIQEITSDYIDVRSVKASQPFKLILLMGKLKE